jgi:glycosyltransferase involved in cell wall biosynthesis
MHVGVNMLYLLPGETGGRETYARELIPAMIEHEPNLRITAFVNREAGPQLGGELGDRVSAVVLPISARRRTQWAFGELVSVAMAARRARVELLHSMANFAPPWGPFRRVVTIHDLHFQAVPELLSWPMRTGSSMLVRMGARHSDRIIAVSASGREEILAGLGIERDRIDVIPNGVRPPPPAPSTTGVRERHRLGRRTVVLTVASNLPHKNLPVLIEALAAVGAEERPLLVLAGQGTDDETLRAQTAALGVAEDVRLLGSVSTEELDSLYALADCLVLPTLHEGFGLPVLEAMARSVPVLCSDIPALREVAGDAALYFQPYSLTQIAAALVRALSDPGLSANMRKLGHARAGHFSWSAAATRTLESYRQALKM